MTLYGIDLWAAALVFARIGGALMLMPGFGEAYVPPRARLALAMALTVCLVPSLMNILPRNVPTTEWGMAGVVIGELMIGLIIGGVARTFMSALGTAGQIMGLESGLSFATTADPTAEASGQIFSVFLGLMGATLIFSTDLHHLLLRGLAGSYGIFTPGADVPIDDATALAVDTVAKSFLVGFQIAAPLLVAGIIFRLGLGALARLIPTIQVFFVVLPLQVLGAFVIIALGLSTGMLVWLDSIETYAKGLN
ncbi:MAG: flagellar biosynthetic protein FliR [Caulobacterales bacterium]